MSFWTTESAYLELLRGSDWYREKWERAASIAWADRRFTARLAELTFREIVELERAGRDALNRPGRHDSFFATDEGNGHARDYLKALSQLSGQALCATVAATAIHESIQKRQPLLSNLALPDPPGRVGSAMIGLVGGGSVATGAAMRTVQRYRTTTFVH